MPSTTVQQAAKILRSGGIVAFPTETVYGLGADATNPHAVARVFEAKNRPRFDPLIVHVASLADAETVAEFTPLARELASAFWPGPLTLVLPKHPGIPGIVTAGLDTVGVRVPNHMLALELLREARCPVAAPSANPFGYISPTTAAHVHEQLGTKVDAVLDGGPCRVGVESTVVRLTGNAGDEIEVLRPGGLPQEELGRFPGVRAVRAVAGIAGEGTGQAHGMAAPGQLSSHYAPRVQLKLLALGERAMPGTSSQALLAFCHAQPGYGAVEVLSPAASLTEAAANLFGAMHRLDASGLHEIVAERAPDEGLGRAINDRLQRAAAH